MEEVSGMLILYIRFPFPVWEFTMCVPMSWAINRSYIMMGSSTTYFLLFLVFDYLFQDKD